MAENSYTLNTFLAPPPAAIKPYTGVFGRKQLQHLLRRTLFGASNADLKAFEGKTLTQVVDALLDIKDFNPAPPLNDYSLSRGAYLTEPVYEKNPDGTFKLDQFGNKIAVKDAKGNDVTVVVKDANGKNIIAAYATGVPDTNDIKYGETWVNFQGNSTNDGQRRASFKSWWAGLMINQERNIREKMTLFFANHFSMEADTVSNAVFTYNSNVLTRKYCVGNFKDLVRDITLDAGMLIYLNGNRNTKAAPDENYGRELQELFTIGKGAGSKYTEDDVKAAAKVLTGWTVLRGQNNFGKVMFTPATHDTSNKTFSAFYGNKVISGAASTTEAEAKKEIDAMLDMIFANNEVAMFMARKLYIYFVHYDITADIETNVITPLAELLRTSKYEIKPVLKALFTSDYFFKSDVIGSMIKSPLDHLVGLYRELEIEIPKDPALFEMHYQAWRSVMGGATAQGQNIQDPPNVAGWPAYYQAPFFYEIWLDTASYPTRKNQQTNFVSNGISMGDGVNVVNPDAREKKIKVNYASWLKSFSNPTSAFDLINEIAEMFYGVEVSQTVKDKLKTNKLWYKIGAISITKDKEWSDAVTAYMANPATTDPLAKSIPIRMQTLVNYMMTAAEYHLH